MEPTEMTSLSQQPQTCTSTTKDELCSWPCLQLCIMQTWSGWTCIYPPALVVRLVTFDWRQLWHETWHHDQMTPNSPPHETIKCLLYCINMCDTVAAVGPSASEHPVLFTDPHYIYHVNVKLLQYLLVWGHCWFLLTSKSLSCFILILFSILIKIFSIIIPFISSLL